MFSRALVKAFAFKSAYVSRYWQPYAHMLFMMYYCPLLLSVPASSPTPHGTRPLSFSSIPWTPRPYELGTGGLLPSTHRLRLVLGPFVTLSLRPEHLASRPPFGDRIPRVPAIPATPTTEAITIIAPPGAVAVIPFEDDPRNPPRPCLPLALPVNLPPDAAIPGTGRIPITRTPTVTSPAALDPEVAPAPPPIEVGSQAYLSRSGARLALFAPAWVAAPPLIRTIVTRGFHWTWLGRPPRLRPPSFSQSRPDLLLPVQDWVTKGVVYPVPPQPCFQSRTFTVPRPDGRPPRLIIDLSPLNPFIQAPQFHLDNHSTLAQVLLPPAHMAALDISEAYTHIPIRHNLHRYLAFSFQNQLYFFWALPFGLNVAPFIFTRVMDWPLRTLRIQGINIPAYLDDIVLAPLPHHSPPTRDSHNREALCHGVSGQSPEVPVRTPNDPPMAGHPLAPADRALAGVPKHQGQNPVVYPPAPSQRPHHPQALGGSGGPHKFCLPGAYPFEGLSLTSDSRGVPSFPPGQRRLSTHSPNTPPGITVLGRSQHLGICPTHPGDPSPSVSLDGRLSLGMGRTPPPPSHNSRPLGATGDSPPHKCAWASGGQPGHHSLQPVVLSPCRVYGQRDSSVRVNAPPHSLPPVTRGTERSFTRHGQATGFYPPAPHPHHPQCGGGRPEPAWTAQHGVDAASRGLPSNSSLGRSPTSRSPGLSDQLPSSAVGLPLSSPGCSGLQLSKFRLERLRQHLCVSTGRTNPDSAATHPRLQRSSRTSGSLRPIRVLVAVSPPAGTRPPPPADDAIPILRTRPGLPQVGDLRALDRISFLRQALLTSRPAVVIDTLLASYHLSSQRQQEVAWTAFHRWLPLDRSTVTKDDILAFL